jgi:magnesium transporter
VGEVTAAIFRNGRLVEHVPLEASVPKYGEAEFIWIEMLDPADSDFVVLQDRFHLHCLAVEESMTAGQVPKVDLYDGQIFVVLKTARLESDEIRYGEVGAFVSAHHVITIRRAADMRDPHPHAGSRNRPRPSPLTPDFVLHSILEVAVNGYFPVVQMIEDEVLAMEQHLQDALLDREEINRLFRLRREAIHFQHVLTRMSDVCGKLTNLSVPCIGAEVRPYFRDVHDQLMRLDGMVSGLIDVIRTVFETSNLLEQKRQGIITRQLAAWAAILGVPATIAGVYGATFTNVPQFNEPLAYGIVVGVMVTICLALYVRFRNLHWL